MLSKDNPDLSTQDAVKPALPGARIGRLVALDAEGSPLVDFPGLEEVPGEGRGPRRALLAAPWPQGPLEGAVGRRVVLLFEDHRLDRPIIVGWVEEAPGAAVPAPRRVRIDGEQILVEGQRRLELKCGNASLVLTEDGRVLLKGIHVLTEARRIHKIRGASVRIN